MKKQLLILLFSMILGTISSQKAPKFDRQDTLRGSITEERLWWDLEHYELSINVNPTKESITGWNTISYEVLETSNIMQIDLQEPMKITKVLADGTPLFFKRDGNVYYIELEGPTIIGSHQKLTIYFEGNPKKSLMPPWDGGLTWTKDENNKPFIATSCQGEGASLWWPCKDHMYDEPDSMLIHIKVPKNLTNVSNGKLRKIIYDKNGSATYTWTVVNPINNYGVNMNVGNYLHFSEEYEGENGTLDCDYWVLDYNLDKAKEQFKQVPLMLEAFEHWFGPYPFYEDGYKLVEVPYLGMEHQSSVTYGNKYKNGYLGRDMSGTGWGEKFDYIIVHESGHEWFANNITYKDAADMWIHESFTTYSEALFIDYHYGKEASKEYVIGIRKRIKNDRPIIGHYDVNHTGSGDMYFKGSNILHMIRTFIMDDEKWREILRGLNEEFYHQTVTTQQVEEYIIEKSNIDLRAFFDQYLRTADIPVLQYYVKEDQLFFRWTNCIESFDMQAQIYSGDFRLHVYPTTKWDQIEITPLDKKWKLNENYYAKMKKGKD